MELDNQRCVVVTGASGGVGRATAVAFARQGHRVGLIARGAAGLSGARQDIEAAGGQAITLPADVADPDAVERAADKVEREFGPIDIWVNNAMVTVYAPVAEMTAEEYRRVTKVTYLGQVYGTLAALRCMRPRGRGTIVNVGSALAYRSIPLQSAYCGAKFAVRGFTDSLRTELIHSGSRIRVTMVHLPGLNTPQFDWARNKMRRKPQPVPPIFQPEVAARAILRAAREAPRELWVGRPTLKTIVGNMLAPGWLDQFLARKAWQGQLSNEPAQTEADNLFDPVAADFGAHGRFDSRASDSAWEIDPTPVRKVAAWMGIGFLVAAASCALGMAGRPRSRSGRVTPVRHIER